MTPVLLFAFPLITAPPSDPAGGASRGSTPPSTVDTASTTAPSDVDAASDASADPDTTSSEDVERSPEGKDSTGEVLSAPGDIDLADVFGTGDSVEDLPDLEEDTGTTQRSLGDRLADKLTWRMRIVSSIYVDVDGSVNGKRWRKNVDERGRIGRNENRLEFYLNYTPNKHVQIVGGIEPVFFGTSRADDLSSLSDVNANRPFFVESDAAYIALNDIAPGLDIKLGRQIVVWGTADKFNPTNNINADDLEDRPLFTEPIANQMVTVDYAPWSDRLWFQGVYVPLFQPALLPNSASQALQDWRTLPPYVQQQDLDAIRYLQGYIAANPKFIPQIFSHLQRPDPSLRNGQAAFKLGSKIGVVDLSASYYYGFHDIPLPTKVESQQIAPTSDDLETVPKDERYWFRSDVFLTYPRMHVAGLDFATQVPFLDDLGLWGEAAMIIPAKQYTLYTELPVLIDVTPGDGVGNPIRFVDGPTTLGRNGRSYPFIKATAGMDYTIGKHVYLQAQYLHGFIDEFGAGNMGDYLVSGTDIVFFGRHLVFRFFAVTQFPDRSRGIDAPSVVLAPDIIVVPPWGFATFELGGFGFVGRNDTKFGQSATGTSIVYFKVTGQF